MIPIPDKYFLVSSFAEGNTKLNAFDNSLLNSGIGNTNLLKISSIIPPKCKKINPTKLAYGSLVPIAYASKISEIPNEIICAGVSCGFPEDENKPGLIMEYSSSIKNFKEIQRNSDKINNYQLEKLEEKVKLILEKMIIEGMLYRKEKIKNIKFSINSHQIKKIGAVFAGVVLCY